MKSLPHIEFFQENRTDESKPLDEWQWYWRARGANGEIVATSEGYTRREDAERGAVDAARVFNTIVIEWWTGSFGKNVLTDDELDAVHRDGFRRAG